MPQISPIMWPIVTTLLVLTLLTVNSTIEKIGTENTPIVANLSPNENNWNW